MTLTVILQEFWRRRILIGLALLLSLAAGAVVAYRVTPTLPPHFKSRQYQVGVASVRMLVDTPNSIVADLNPSGASSLSLHAQLLANLLASQSIRTTIAASVGIPIQDLAVVPPAISAAPIVATPLATATVPPADASTLTISVDPTLPIVSISAQAPDRVGAANLANGAVTALRAYLVSVAGAQKIPTSRRPVITSLGALSGTATRGRSRILGVAAALVLFSLLSYVILIVGGLRRRVRMAAPHAEAAAGPVPASPEPSPAESNGNLHEPSLPVANGNLPGHEPGPARAPAGLVAGIPPAAAAKGGWRVTASGLLSRR